MGPEQDTQHRNKIIALLKVELLESTESLSVGTAVISKVHHQIPLLHNAEPDVGHNNHWSYESVWREMDIKSSREYEVTHIFTKIYAVGPSITIFYLQQLLADKYNKFNCDTIICILSNWQYWSHSLHWLSVYNDLNILFSYLFVDGNKIITSVSNTPPPPHNFYRAISFIKRK